MDVVENKVKRTGLSVKHKSVLETHAWARKHLRRTKRQSAKKFTGMSRKRSIKHKNSVKESYTASRSAIMILVAKLGKSKKSKKSKNPLSLKKLAKVDEVDPIDMYTLIGKTVNDFYDHLSELNHPHAGEALENLSILIANSNERIAGVVSHITGQKIKESDDPFKTYASLGKKLREIDNHFLETGVSADHDYFHELLMQNNAAFIDELRAIKSAMKSKASNNLEDLFAGLTL